MPSTYAFQYSASVLKRVVFLWTKASIPMGTNGSYCSLGAHIGVNRLIFLGLIVIFPTVTVVYLPGK